MNKARFVALGFVGVAAIAWLLGQDPQKCSVVGVIAWCIFLILSQGDL